VSGIYNIAMRGVSAAVEGSSGYFIRPKGVQITGRSVNFRRAKALGPQFGHFLVRVFNRPKGENRTAQAFRPGKVYEKKIALKGRPTSGRYSQKVTFV